MSKATIVIVEDDAQQADLVKSVLEAEHYSVSVAKTALQGRSLVEKARPDLVILDRHLPDKDGLEFCQELRAQPAHASILVLFLTGRKTMTEKLMGLKLGGDDYMTKPFSPEELVMRVEVLLRRGLKQSGEASTLKTGPIELNVEGRIARVDGKEVELTNKEFDLLRAFVERPERVLTRAFLLSHVWGYGLDVEINTKAVNVMIMGLRKKLGRHADCVEAVKNVGYRFRPPETR